MATTTNATTSIQPDLQLTLHTVLQRLEGGRGRANHGLQHQGGDRSTADGVPNLIDAIRNTMAQLNTTTATAPTAAADKPTELLTLQGHSGMVNSVAFSPDGSRIVTGSYDNTAKIWNAVAPFTAPRASRTGGR